MIIINEINDERIVLYRSLRNTPQSHLNEKVFIAEGDIAVAKLLESNIEICSVFCTDKYYKDNFIRIVERVAADRRYVANKELMDQIVGFRLHKGIMAIALQPKNTSISELKSPIIILNGIVNSENVGAIVRNCIGFCVNSMIVDKKTSSPYLRRAVRCSMGAIFYMDIHFSDDLSLTIQELKSNGYGIFAAENHNDALDLSGFDFPKQYALVFGSEGNGIDDHILDHADKVIKIAISDKIASINVAASSAIFFHKMSRK
jgi:tRNA G18 (ribose-2'-O)-methylase SpoU